LAIIDRYGHFTGDRLLRHVADQLRAEVEPDGAVGRIGGDEFLVIHSIRPPTSSRALVDPVVLRIGHVAAPRD
jgi:diguanylate cyclase